MQNKGFVKFLAVALTLVCVFYLSFSFVSHYHMKKAAENHQSESAYVDSLGNQKVWLWSYTLKQCREMEIGLGLDLKGGMNVILEVSIPDIVKALSGNKTDQNFLQAISTAKKLQASEAGDFVTLFIREYKKLAPGSNLAELFATEQLSDKINPRTSDSAVEQVMRDEINAAVKNSYNVLRTRIDRFGVAQPNIQLLENNIGRIMIELPGVKDPKRVADLLQGSANLEFWETYDASEIVPYITEADKKIREILAENETEDAAADTLAVTEKTNLADNVAKAATGDSQEKQSEAALKAAKKQNPLLSILHVYNSRSALLGVARYQDTATINKYLAMSEVKELLPSDLRLKWSVKANEREVFELFATKFQENTQENVHNGPILAGDVISTAKDDYDQYNHPSVSMSMNSEGSTRWADITKRNIGKSIAIVLDGLVYSAPNVNGEISGGNSQITGNFTLEEAKDLANVLKSGKMPAPARIVQEDTVGPSLGQASINQGVISFAVALVLLMVYMCSMYGLIPGMVANAALLFNLFFTLGILSSFQAALTMSGIAGMVLSLGMAVDANVLIYERTKEELKAGKTLKNAITDGYSNALSAILDSNITSIITGLILFNFGTGLIRGFATTLIIGIFCSFFTAVFLTRLVYEKLLTKEKYRDLNFSSKISRKLMVNSSYNFMNNAKKSFIIFGIIVIACLASVFTRGFSQSIDFTGGRNFVVAIEQTISPEKIAEMVNTKAAELNNSEDKASFSVIKTQKGYRISTNYRINEDATSVDTEIEAFLFKALKPVLSSTATFDTFTDRENLTDSIISSQKVGPTIADDIKDSAVISVLLSLLAIFLYVLLRFRNIAYSVGSVLALSVDTIIIIGLFSALWGFVPFSLELDQAFIGAVLTAIGYSINDKVVIFDRIREFFHLHPKQDKKKLFNDSLNTTLARTINTSVSTLIVLLCVFLLGGDSIRGFSFAMILGVVVGTSSSLFLASPIAYLMINKKK